MAVKQRKAQNSYLETSIMTASREDLIIKTFDALILLSGQALAKLRNEGQDVEAIHNYLLRAQKACTLLMGSLNMEIGGELAKNLFRVYEYWHHELVMANMKKDPARIERLMPTFKEYRETWQEAISRFKTEQRTNQRAVTATPVTTHAPRVSSFAALG